MIWPGKEYQSMRLNLNSPAYHSHIFGIDSEVYNMCSDLRKFVSNKQYSEIIDTIGIVPIVAPKEQIESGKWKEVIKVDIKYKIAFVSKQIDYDKYCLSNIDERKELIITNILDSVKAIHKKAKINYDKFELDVIEFIKSNNY